MVKRWVLEKNFRKVRSCHAGWCFDCTGKFTFQALCVSPLNEDECANLHFSSSPFLPPFLPASLPPSLPPSLPASLPSFLPSSLPSFLPSFLPTFLPPFLPPSLPPFLLYFHSFFFLSLSFFLKAMLVNYVTAEQKEKQMLGGSCP